MFVFLHSSLNFTHKHRTRCFAIKEEVPMQEPRPITYWDFFCNKFDDDRYTQEEIDAAKAKRPNFTRSTRQVIKYIGQTYTGQNWVIGNNVAVAINLAEIALWGFVGLCIGVVVLSGPFGLLLGACVGLLVRILPMIIAIHRAHKRYIDASPTLQVARKKAVMDTAKIHGNKDVFQIIAGLSG